MNVDLDALAHEFNIEMDEALDSMEDNPIDIENLSNNEPINPDIVVSTNINKANAILDRVILEINRSGMSPRLAEVAGQLIANINQSVSQIYTKEFDMSGLRLKKKMVELKEREVIIKENTIKRDGGNIGTVNNNLIVTDRETVLKLLKENKEKLKLLENTNESERESKNDASE